MGYQFPSILFAITTSVSRTVLSTYALKKKKKKIVERRKRWKEERKL